MMKFLPGLRCNSNFIVLESLMGHQFVWLKQKSPVAGLFWYIEEKGFMYD
jgi:hypothetical protein